MTKSLKGLSKKYKKVCKSNVIKPKGKTEKTIFNSRR